jgi:hypothetical protein
MPGASPDGTTAILLQVNTVNELSERLDWLTTQEAAE